jgi:hypothetical protein
MKSSKKARAAEGILRCEAMITISKTGRRCREDAMEGTDPPRCERHWGQFDARSIDHQDRKWSYMPRFYIHALKPALREYLELHMQDIPMVETLDLSEEIGLMRLAATDAVEYYAKACIAEGEPQKVLQAKLLAGEVMKQGLQSVIDAVDKGAKVQEVKLRVTGAMAEVMTSFVMAVVQSAYAVFQDDHKVKEFEETIREQMAARSLSISQGVPEGTLLTPDQDAVSMDDTIPGEQDDPS